MAAGLGTPDAVWKRAVSHMHTASYRDSGRRHGTDYDGLDRAFRIVPVAVELHLLHLRSEEHTSELQSQSNLVCRLLLDKKTHHLTAAYDLSLTAAVAVLRVSSTARRTHRLPRRDGTTTDRCAHLS